MNTDTKDKAMTTGLSKAERQKLRKEIAVLIFTARFPSVSKYDVRKNFESYEDTFNKLGSVAVRGCTCEECVRMADPIVDLFADRVTTPPAPQAWEIEREKLLEDLAIGLTQKRASCPHGA